MVGKSCQHAKQDFWMHPARSQVFSLVWGVPALVENPNLNLHLRLLFGGVFM